MVILLGMLWLMPKALLPTAFDGTSKSPSAAAPFRRQGFARAEVLAC